MNATAGALRAQDARQYLEFETSSLDPVRYRVRCLPARDLHGHATNYSLQQLGDHRFRSWLGNQLAMQNVRKAYAPTVHYMSGLLLPREHFTILYPLGSGVELLRPGAKHHSAEPEECDGTSLERNECFLMSAAGCMLLVLTGRTPTGEAHCFVAHAGRDSLVDRRKLSGGRPRPYGSVVEAMVKYAAHRKIPRCSMTLRGFFSIPWEAYPHPLTESPFADMNQQLYDLFLHDYGENTIFQKRNDGVMCLSLPDLVACQAGQEGIGTVHTHLCGLPEDGDYAYTTHSDERLAGLVRNLVWLQRY